MEKLDKWQKIKVNIAQRRQEQEERSKQIELQEKKKQDKIRKKQQEMLEDSKLRIEMQQYKWGQRV